MAARMRSLLVFLYAFEVLVIGSERKYVPPKGKVNIYCELGTTIKIQDIEIEQESTGCQSQLCKPPEEAKQKIQNACNDKKNCEISADIGLDCLQENGNLNISYYCTDSPLDCNFDKNLCQWSSVSEGNCKWMLFDNMYYHYIYLSGGMDSAFMTSQTFHTSSPTCMTLDYYKHHECEGGINLHVNNRTISDLSAGFGSTTKADIFEVGELNIAIEGVCNSCAIKVYSIKLLPGKCEGSPLDCDFTKDICPWKSMSNSSCKWIWNYIYYGWQLNDNDIGTSAYLTSPSIYISSESCLKIEYNMYNLQSDCERKYDLYLNNTKIRQLSSGSEEIDILKIGLLNIKIKGVCGACRIQIYDIKFIPGKCSGEQKYMQSCLNINKEIKINVCSPDPSIDTYSLEIDPHVGLCIQEYNDTHMTPAFIMCYAVGDEEMCLLNFTNVMDKYADCFKINRLSVLYECQEINATSTPSVLSSVQSTVSNTDLESTDSGLTYIPNPNQSNNSGIMTWVGLVLGIVILVSLVAVSVFIWKRRYKKDTSDMHSEIVEEHHLENLDTASRGSDQRHSYAEIKLNTKSKKKKSTENNNKNARNELSDATYNHIDWKSTDNLYDKYPNSTKYDASNPAFESNLTGSYEVLDPQVTGYNRTKRTDDYELSNDISKSKHQTVVDYENPYNKTMFQGDDTYNTTTNFEREEYEDNVYSHSVDTVYDTTVHGRKKPTDDDNYDHFIAKERGDV